MYELICPAKINVSDVNELDVKMIFGAVLYGPAAFTKGNIVMTLLYMCYLG